MERKLVCRPLIVTQALNKRLNKLLTEIGSVTRCRMCQWNSRRLELHSWFEFEEIWEEKAQQRHQVPRLGHGTRHEPIRHGQLRRPRLRLERQQRVREAAQIPQKSDQRFGLDRRWQVRVVFHGRKNQNLPSFDRNLPSKIQKFGATFSQFFGLKFKTFLIFFKFKEMQVGSLHSVEFRSEEIGVLFVGWNSGGNSFQRLAASFIHWSNLAATDRERTGVPAAQRQTDAHVLHGLVQESAKRAANILDRVRMRRWLGQSLVIGGPAAQNPAVPRVVKERGGRRQFLSERQTLGRRRSKGIPRRLVRLGQGVQWPNVPERRAVQVPGLEHVQHQTGCCQLESRGFRVSKLFG